MTPSVLAWILAVVASLVAAGLFMYLRSVQAERDALTAALAAQESETETLEERLENRAKEQQKRNEEMADLRAKLEKTRKRAGDKNQNQHSVASQIQELEEALALERSKLAELRAELRASGNQPTPAKKPAQPSPPVETKPAVPPLDPAKLAQAEQQLEARTRELEAATNKVKALTEEIAPARQTASREIKKREALDKAYTQLRLELEIRKNEVHAQRTELERLRALKVALTDQPDLTPPEDTEPSPPDPPPIEPDAEASPEPE